jgi:hypothetical protein
MLSLRRFGIFAAVASLLTLGFASSVAAQEPDTDRDGFPDSQDRCPNEWGEGGAGGSEGGQTTERGATGCPGDTEWDFASAKNERPTVTKRGWTFSTTVFPNGVRSVSAVLQWDVDREFSNVYEASRYRDPYPNVCKVRRCRPDNVTWGQCVPDPNKVRGRNQNDTRIEASARMSCKEAFDRGPCVLHTVWVHPELIEDHEDFGTRPRFILRNGPHFTGQRVDRPDGPTDKPSCAKYPARMRAIAKCKKMPTATKTQRQKRANCLAKARRIGM